MKITSMVSVFVFVVIVCANTSLYSAKKIDCKTALDKCLDEAFGGIETVQKGNMGTLKGLFCLNGYIFCKLYVD